MEFSKEELIELIDAFNSKIDRYEKEFSEFKTQFNEFLDKAESNYNDWDHETRCNEFKEKYKDSFDPIAEDVKKAEEDDNFDIGSKIFDDYEASDKSYSEEEYVATVVASLTEQLNKLKEATGAEEIKVKTDEDGSATVEADGEKIAEAETVDETTIKNEDEDDDVADLEKEYSKYEKMFNI